jgi:predicted permease
MNWLRRLRARRSADRDLEEEIRQHLDEKVEELVAQGVPAEDALWRARQAFGNVTVLKERSHDVWRSARLHDLWCDVRYACRFLRRSKSFAAASILTLALGIGANAAVFSILNAILFRPLPFPESDRLVSVQLRDTRGTPHSTPLSYPTFFDLRRANTLFEHFVCYRDEAFTLTERGPAVRLAGEIVSWDLFAVLRVTPMLGRGFVAADEGPGTRVAVLSHELWSTSFGADPGVVGTTITLDREPYVVVGVAPSGFTFPVGRAVRLWTTLARDATAGTGQPVTEQRGARMLDSIARLKPQASLAAAQAEMDAITGVIAAEHPDQNRNIASTYVRSALEQLVGVTRMPLMILLSAVSLLLLIACANIANLLLARVMDRARELAMRMAIGASRARLIRQVLTENLVITVIGSAVGVLLAAVAVHVAAPLWPDGLPRATDIAVDWPVVLFCVCLALITAGVIGLPTVFRLAHVDVSCSLRTGSWGNTQGNDRTRSGLVVAQVALGLTLLCGATLLLEGFLHLVQRDLGFQPDHLLTFNISVPGGGDRQQAFVEQLLERIRHTPGVTAAAAGSPLPLTGHQMKMSFGIQERPVAPSDRPYADMAIVTPGFFRTIATVLEEGRDFTDGDDEHSVPVLVVNRAFADRFFPGERALGKRIEPGATLKNQRSMMREIVGIVGDARQSPLGVDREPIYYFPYKQLSWFPPAIVVRTIVPPAALAATFRSLVSELDSHVPVDEMFTMHEVLSTGVAGPRVVTVLLGTFAILALFLTAVGLYGVIAYAVSKQTREIGVRIALGATKSSITADVMKRAAKLVGFGVVLGLGGSLAAGRVLGSLLHGFPIHNARVLIVACVMLAVSAATAAFLPARRAASIDPLQALRAE